MTIPAMQQTIQTIFMRKKVVGANIHVHFFLLRDSPPMNGIANNKSGA